MLLTEAIDQYLLSLKADGLSPATIKWYRSILRSFSNDYPLRELEAFTVNTMRSYIVKLREKNVYDGAVQRLRRNPEASSPAPQKKVELATVDSHVTALHAFWGWCAREYVLANPMGNIRRPPPRDRHIKAIAPEDFVKIFNATTEGAAGTRDRALLTFLADTGARLGGVHGLQWEYLNIDEGWALVLEKGARLRKVVFTQMTARFLLAWRNLAYPQAKYVFTSVQPPFDQLSKDGIEQILKRLKARARVEGRVNPHSFRHNFAREYLRNGGDLVSLARLLGHKDIKVTSDYYAIFSQDELAVLHEKYSPLKEMLK